MSETGGEARAAASARHDQPGPAAGGGTARADAARVGAHAVPRFPGWSSGRDTRLAAAVSRLAVWSARLLLIAAGLALLGWLTTRLWVIILPVLLGLLLATVLWPPMRLLRRVLPNALAALLVLLAGVAALAALLVWLVPQITGQAQQLADAVSAGLENVQAWLTGPPLNLGREQIGSAVDSAVSALQSNAQSIASTVLSSVTTVGSFLVTALLAVVLCFFYLKDGDRFLPWISRLAGPAAAPHIAEVSRRSWTVLSGFIRAQAAVGLIDAVGIGIGLVVLGVPLALPLAVLIFFGAFVPIIGATVTGALAALVALVSNGFTTALIVVALVLVVQQLEGNVLQPFLVGRTLNLHPALVILAVTVGGTFAGVIGALLAVPVVAVATTVLRYARQQLDGPHALEPAEPPPPES